MAVVSDGQKSEFLNKDPRVVLEVTKGKIETRNGLGLLRQFPFASPGPFPPLPPPSPVWGEEL